MSRDPLRLLFVLPGLHRIARGAEVAFLEIAERLCARGHRVTMMGAGEAPAQRPYEYVRVPAVHRRHFERLPGLPALRNEFAWEELTFLPGLLRCYRPDAYDVTLTCSFPFSNWALSRHGHRGRRPKHVFVTQNGDWPAVCDRREFRWFRCDGLVCINPEYQQRNEARYRCALIPNGADVPRFQRPAPPPPATWNLPSRGRTVLMVSALEPGKRVLEAIPAVAANRDAHLVVAGDGPLRDEMEREARRQLPGRFTRLHLPREEMPRLYQACDAFLHMAVDEPFGNVFVEAMASGLPVIAHESERTRWILGERHVLVDTHDPEQTAKAVDRALSVPAAARETIAARASRFDWDEIAERYERFLYTIAGER